MCSELERLDLAHREIETSEALRRAEIGRIERRLQDIRQREVRIERCRWRVAGVRRNVISRNRFDHKALVDQVSES